MVTRVILLLFFIETGTGNETDRKSNYTNTRYIHPRNTRHISLMEMLAQTDMETAENSCR